MSSPVKLGFDENGNLTIRVLKSVIDNGYNTSGDYYEYKAPPIASSMIEIAGNIDDDAGCRTLQLDLAGQIVQK